MPEKDDDAADPEFFEIWHENWKTVLIFDCLRSQWRKIVVSGMGGGGMFYDSIRYDIVLMPGGLLDLYNVKSHRRLRVLQDLMIMESAAMAIMNKQSK
jgi:hypothetical protein